MGDNHITLVISHKYNFPAAGFAVGGVSVKFLLLSVAKFAP
jgi:hypothetical protein